MQTSSATLTSPPDWTFALQEASRRASGLLVAGVVLRMIQFQIAGPIFALGIGVLTTRLAVNLNSRYTVVPLHEAESMQLAAEDVVRTYPSLQLVTFLFALALSWLWAAGSLSVGFALGALGALAIERKPCLEKG